MYSGPSCRHVAVGRVREQQAQAVERLLRDVRGDVGGERGEAVGLASEHVAGARPGGNEGTRGIPSRLMLEIDYKFGSMSMCLPTLGA